MSRTRILPKWLALSGAVALLCTPLVAAAEDGKEIFLRSKCTTCHTIESAGVTQPPGEADEEEKPKDLSDVGSKHDAAWIKDWLQKKVEQNGKSHRKRFGGTPAELDVLAKWLTSLKKPKP